jgi:hypothetical protein
VRGTVAAEHISFTIAASCAATGLSADTLYRRHQAGEITLRKAGQRTLVTREDLERLIASLPALPRR